MTKILHLLFLILLSPLLLSPVFAQKSQIRIIPQDQQEFTSERIVKGLVSGGLELLSIRTNFTESSLAMGYFHDPVRYMGIEQGMVLSTGAVHDLTRENTESNYTSLAGPGKDNGSTIILSNKQAPTTVDTFQNEVDAGHDVAEYVLKCDDFSGDPDLSAEIAGLQTFDARVVEVTFRPTADTFYYRYVFASEEYDEYVCSAYNDIFAFYISKKGGSKVNTAIIPNKNLPVSINTINAGNPANPGCPTSNSYLYQRNNGKQNLLFDGFTKVLDIRHKVEPGEEYTIKIALADATDCYWDSAVLIENNSIFSYFKSFEMNFASDSAIPLQPGKLEEIMAYISTHPNCKIQLIGHSDRIGSASYNYELSVERVVTIRNALMANGIDQKRIFETCKGETMPRYEDHARNRRVEIFILGE